MQSISSIRNQVGSNLPGTTSRWVEVFARFGYIALGVVYCLMGGLTAMAAFGINGGQKTSREEVFLFLLQQPMGKVLMGLMALGLISYTGWQLVQAIKDPRHGKTNTAGGYGRRLGYALSALTHGAFALYAAKLALGNSGEKSNSSQQTAIATVLDLPAGKWLLILVAAGIIIFGLYQIYQSVSARFMRYVEEGNIKPEVYAAYKKAGTAGYFARGVVSCIIGYLLGQAAIQYNPGQAGDTEDVYRFLESTSIPFLLGIVAVGLLCYGIFLFIRARYQRFGL